MAVQFRLLGDVEAWCGETRLDIGHARQRCVLVALTIDVNRPVTPGGRQHHRSGGSRRDEDDNRRRQRPSHLPILADSGECR